GIAGRGGCPQAVSCVVCALAARGSAAGATFPKHVRRRHSLGWMVPRGSLSFAYAALDRSRRRAVLSAGTFRLDDFGLRGEENKDQCGTRRPHSLLVARERRFRDRDRFERGWRRHPQP